MAIVRLLVLLLITIVVVILTVVYLYHNKTGNSRHHNRDNIYNYMNIKSIVVTIASRLSLILVR